MTPVPLSVIGPVPLIVTADSARAPPTVLRLVVPPVVTVSACIPPVCASTLLVKTIAPVPVPVAPLRSTVSPVSVTAPLYVCVVATIVPVRFTALSTTRSSNPPLVPLIDTGLAKISRRSNPLPTMPLVNVPVVPRSTVSAPSWTTPA